MFKRLLIALFQVKVGNVSECLLNEILQMIFFESSRLNTRNSI